MTVRHRAARAMRRLGLSSVVESRALRRLVGAPLYARHRESTARPSNAPASAKNGPRGEVADVSGSATPVGPLVSVVVPVYKVEEYIDECVESILSQSYRHIEVILVDDGSPDRCGEICDGYARKHKRVSVIHKANGGLSSARNVGARVARGEYLMFVDSDDLLMPGAIERLVETALESGSDIVSGNVQRFRGTKVWQGWNQSFSHVRSLYPSANDPETRYITVSLKDAPGLLFDATAWNKLYRTTFFRGHEIKFPEGKLYEDMLPVSTAYSRARGIDILFEPVYRYRERENKTSITQARGEFRNLADKVEMMGRVLETVSDGGPALVQAVAKKALEGDLPVYSPYLGSDDAFDSTYYSALRRYWELADVETIAALSLSTRVLFSLQLAGQPDAREAEAWTKDHFFEIPVECDANGAPSVVIDGLSALRELREPHMRSMARYVKPVHLIRDVSLRGGRLVIEGYAYLDFVPTSAAVALELALESSSGVRVVLPHTSDVDPWANVGWNSGLWSREASGFLVDVGAEDLTDLGLADGPETWTLTLRLDGAGHDSTVPATQVWRGGSLRRGDVIDLGEGRTMHVDWNPWREPLRLVVDEIPVKASVVRSTEKTIELVVSGASLPDGDLSVRAVRAWDRRTVRGRTLQNEQGERRCVLDLAAVPKRDASGGQNNDWWLEVEGEGLPTQVVRAVEANTAATPSWPWSVRAVSSGALRIVDESSLFLVDAAWIDADQLHVSGRLPERLPLRVGAAGRAASVQGGDADYLDGHETADSHRSGFSLSALAKDGDVLRAGIVATDDRRFSVVLPLTRVGWFGGTVAVPVGNYVLSVVADDGSPTPYRLRAARELLSEMVISGSGDYTSSSLQVVSDTYEMSLHVGAPLSLAERGRYARWSSWSAWKSKEDSEIEPLDAVLYSSFMGASASDSPLAMFEEFSRRLPGWQHYWAVSDMSVPVPMGATPLVKDSQFWYEVASRARVVVNNVGALFGYGDRPHQYYVQTWHGTPLKYVGVSHAEADPANSTRAISRIAEESAEWDLLVSPNAFFSSIARDEFRYSGDIQESGYPRNDRLVTGGSEDEVRELRARLGLPESAKVLLYAPTWRDKDASGARADLTGVLDLDRLAHDLGDEWVVVLRGHNYNVRSSRRDRSRGRIVDLSTHPDVNDLLIASDVLVTDYSSVMFDYLNTSKPVFLFVPDYAEYASQRGMYFDIREEAPGPVLESREALVAEVQNVDSYFERFGHRYEAQKVRFTSWDTGSSAESVVNTVLRGIGQGARASRDVTSL